MAIAADAIKSARIYLNDINGISWTESVLMPLLQEAFGELMLELERNSISVIKHQSALILVPANTTVLTTSFVITEPLSMIEGAPGDDIENFVEMTKVTFLPDDDPDIYLNYWAWLGQQIQFIGATTNRNVQLRYKGPLVIPQFQTDQLGFIYAERFLGPRIAGLAKDSCSSDGSKLSAMAEKNLYSIIQANVTNDQVPTRRRAYRSSHKVGFGEQSSPSIGTIIYGGGGGSPVNWILTSTPPDGVITTFSFSSLPKYISWNGLNQFLNVGYKLVNPAPGPYSIQLIDSFGATITPGAGDDIRAETN